MPCRERFPNRSHPAPPGKFRFFQAARSPGGFFIFPRRESAFLPPSAAGISHAAACGNAPLPGRGAKGGTRHLRFLIPPLATPPDLPPAATPCGRASKSEGEHGFYLCALLFLCAVALRLRGLPRMTVRGRMVQGGKYFCVKSLLSGFLGVSVGRGCVPDNRLSSFAPLPRTVMRGNRGRSQPQTAARSLR